MAWPVDGGDDRFFQTQQGKDDALGIGQAQHGLVRAIGDALQIDHIATGGKGPSSPGTGR